MNAPALVCVLSDTFRDGEHWVFWDGEHIRDPAPETADVNDRTGYRVLQWIPIIYIDESLETYEGLQELAASGRQGA